MPTSAGAKLTPLRDRFNATEQNAKTYADGLVVPKAYMRRRQTTVYSIPDSTTTVVRFDTQVGTAAGVSYALGDFTVDTDGIYTLDATVTLVSNATGIRRLVITVGGVEVKRKDMVGGAFGTEGQSIDISDTFAMTAGQVARVGIRQTSGGALNTVVDTTRITLKRIDGIPA